MKFICKQENLKRGVGLISHLTGKNQNLPILNNVLLEVKEGVLHLSSTNLEIGVRTIVRGKAEQEGSLTVPARLLNDYIGSLANENIEIEQEDNNLKVSSSNTQTVIKGIEAAEFPLIPEVEEKTTFRVRPLIFRESLAMVLFATAMDNSRPEISGVMMEVKQEGIVMAATDSYRLAEKKLNHEGLDGDGGRVIIPSNTLQEMYRILSDTQADAEIKIGMNENQILFTTDSTKLVSRVIEGEYPDYQQVIPIDTKTQIKVRTQEFLQGVRSASLFCRQGINDVHIVVSNNKMEIKALNDQVGKNQTVIEVEVKGEENDIVFNYHYILDGLNNIGSDEVEFSLNSNSLPGKFIPQGRTDYVYIIMPIKQ